MRQTSPSWQQFAKLARYRFETWIEADEEVANRFRAYATDHAGKEDGPPQTLMVRAWLNPDGTVERVSFDTLKDARADVDLRPILTRGNFGKAGPVSAEARRGPAWIFCVDEANQQRQYRPRDGKAHAP